MSSAVDWFLVALTTAVLLAPLVMRAVRGRLDVFEPIVFFSIAYGFMFVIRPAAMLVDDELVFVSARRALDVSGTFTAMLVLALVGAVSFVVGYELRVGRLLARRHSTRSTEASPTRVVAVAVAVGLVGLTAYVAILASSGLSDSLAAIFRAGNTELPDEGSLSMYGAYLFLMLVPASLVVLGLGLGHRRADLIVLGIVLAGTFAIIAVPSGRRIALLPLLGGMFVLWYLQKGRRPSITTLAAIAVVAVVGATFLSDLRGRTAREEGIVATVQRSTSPSRLVHGVTRGPDTEMAPALAAALAVIPEEVPRGYGTVMIGDLVRRPFPRSLWPDKPLTPRHELLRTIWPVEFENRAINAEFSVLVYFYWDFGLVGLLAGLGVCGVLARYLYECLRRFGNSVHVQVVYALAVWFVVIGLRDSPVDTFVRSCFVLVPVWAIFALARTPALRRAAEMSVERQGA